MYSDFSKIFQLHGDPTGVMGLINPLSFPVSPSPTCKPVYPHNYLKLNTVFGVAHKHQLRTAWSDKHIAYEILNGPSGTPVGTSFDDLFAPEINSSVTDPTPPATPGADWTKDNTNTQKYDAFKAQAVVNWIRGHDHAGNGTYGTPAIFGTNFQAVSTAQKLNKSNYYPDPKNTAIVVKNGHDGTKPGVVLQSALTFVDDKLADMLNDKAFDPTNTVVILSAKHGQSPKNREDLTIINDGDMIDALNCAWEKNSATCKDPTKPHLVAHAIDDDGILMWLNDRSSKAIDFARKYLKRNCRRPRPDKADRADNPEVAGAQPNRTRCCEDGADAGAA